MRNANHELQNRWIELDNLRWYTRQDAEVGEEPASHNLLKTLRLPAEDARDIAKLQAAYNTQRQLHASHPYKADQVEEAYSILSDPYLRDNTGRIPRR